MRASLFIALGLSVLAAFAEESNPTDAPAVAPASVPEKLETEPSAAKAEPVDEREIVTRLQIFLDQQNFGPGKIDGRWGEFTGKAMAKYATYKVV